jgi:DNA polymerase-1
MLKYKWIAFDITDASSANTFECLLNEHKPALIALDTETSGLHIIHDRPFLIQVGFVSKRGEGYSFAVEVKENPLIFQRFLDALIGYFKENDCTLVGHNLKYDMHMLYNIGIYLYKYPRLKFTDTAFIIRYAHDALHTDEGGPPMKLKAYAARYIDPGAKRHEYELKKEQSNIAKNYNIQLRRDLKMTQKQLDSYFKDVVFEPSDLPKEILEKYLDWRNALPPSINNRVQTIVKSDEIPYPMLNRKNLIKYAHFDIVYTLEIYYSLIHVIDGRQQWTAINLENALMLPLFVMERTGFLADKAYLEASRRRLKQFIVQRRKELFDIAEIQFTVNQHALFKRIVDDLFDVKLKSSGKEFLNLIKKEAGSSAPITDFIDRVQELRTLEKWYSAYILRFQKELKNCNRLYTTINQVGTVSGRVTSDFQQFPKKAISYPDEKELFHPRRIVKAPVAIAYLDYSQIELRVQAFYTMLVGHPDKNLCRAYMPFDCVERDGKYYLSESPEVEWTPVDVHAETTKAATGLDENHPDFDKLRTDIGKKVNFSKNYGAQLKRITEMFPDKTEEECNRINDSYYKAFPGIKYYHTYCNDRASRYSNTQSLFGIKYYNVSGHKLKNLLIQGSSAHLLKYKIIDIHNLLRGQGEHIRIQMQIHDELSFEIYDDIGRSFIPHIKALMEDWPDCTVPIVAECEITTTVWAEKRKEHV